MATEDDWLTFHAIRRQVLWDARGQEGYDSDHPDDRAASNHPFLFLAAGRPVGVVRVDLDPPVAWLRRVAIVEDSQRLGHGGKMLEIAENFAREQGCSTVASNVDRDAVGFYKRLGYHPARHDADLRMEKALA
ncbi:MAG: GNAT family N-acetyltransferase [Actinomycetota bacterium]